MKKILLIFVTILFCTACTTTPSSNNSSSSKNESLTKDASTISNFSIPEMQEAQDLFLMFDFLYAAENDPEILTDYYLNGIVENHWYQDNITASFLKSFFRQTNNDSLKFKIINNSGLSIDDPHIQLIVKSMALEESTDSDTGITRYVSDDGRIDENLNLRQITENGLFNNEIVFYEFHNDWIPLEMNDGSETLFLNFGGGTNATFSIIEKEISESTNMFNEVVIKKASLLESKGNVVRIINCSGRGVFEHANADEVKMILAEGVDLFGNSEFTATVLLFSSKNQSTYSVTNFMNFSSKNFSYEIRDDIYRQMAYLTTLTYLN